MACKGTLFFAIKRALLVEKEGLSSEVDAAFVASERSPTPQAARDANQIEARANLHNAQIRRKRVALAACQSDLAKAQAHLQRVQQAHNVLKFEAYVAELAEICTQLEQDIQQPQR